MPKKKATVEQVSASEVPEEAAPEAVEQDSVIELEEALSDLTTLVQMQQEWIEEHRQFHEEEGEHAFVSHFPQAGLGEPYVVQQGDTLAKVAKARYGQSGRMTEILAMNPWITDEMVNNLPVGKKILMPSAT